ncbi:MAG: HEPN domain-containing protein [Flavobacteriaceae bacterium]
MSHLKSKSEFNLDAAEVLIDRHSYYAPSVHCSYYGCFQYIISKLNMIGITYEKIDNDISASRGTNRILNSHTYPVKLILDEMETTTDIFYRKKVKDKIKLLKAFRITSDYRNEDVNHSKSTEALRLSKEIISLINNKL